MIYGTIGGDKVTKIIARDALSCRRLQLLGIGEDSSDAEVIQAEDVDDFRTSQCR